MGREIVSFKGFDFECDVYHQPAEEEVRYYSDGSGYPGCAEEWEFTNITLNRINAEELLENIREQFEEEAIKQLRHEKN